MSFCLACRRWPAADLREDQQKLLAKVTSTFGKLTWLLVRSGQVDLDAPLEPNTSGKSMPTPAQKAVQVIQSALPWMALFVVDMLCSLPATMMSWQTACWFMLDAG